jgi:dolichyl-phosphate-mannose-protein mannosyltransferase
MPRCGLKLGLETAAAIVAASLTLAASGSPPSLSPTASASPSTAATAPPALLSLAVSRNLLVNGDFATGSGIQPDEWRTEAWINNPESFAYSWNPPATGGPGELVVNNLKPNDGRWMQSLTLAPGAYYLSVEIRTENVGANETGATISVMDDGAMSRDIHGTTAWMKAGFYLTVGGTGADVDVALRVGGFGSLDSGRAFFRHASVIKLASLPPGAAPVYDLSELRKQAAPEPIGSPYTLVVAFALLAAAAVVGWRLFGEPPIAEPASKPNGSRTARR